MLTCVSRPSLRLQSTSPFGRLCTTHQVPRTPCIVGVGVTFRNALGVASRGMANRNQRLERAARARDDRLGLAWLEANPPSPCPGCGRPLATRVPGGGPRGRRRIWCSNACRQRAYRARLLASKDTAPPPSSPPELSKSAEPSKPLPQLAMHDLDACIIAVLEDPTATASVLDVVRRASRDGVLDRPEYADVHAALLALTNGQD